jgi:hypothetical protein
MVCLEPSRPDSCFVLPPTPARHKTTEVERRDAAHPDWERDKHMVTAAAVAVGAAPAARPLNARNGPDRPSTLVEKEG